MNHKLSTIVVHSREVGVAHQIISPVISLSFSRQKNKAVLPTSFQMDPKCLQKVAMDFLINFFFIFQNWLSDAFRHSVNFRERDARTISRLYWGSLRLTPISCYWVRFEQKRPAPHCCWMVRTLHARKFTKQKQIAPHCCWMIRTSRARKYTEQKWIAPYCC